MINKNTILEAFNFRHACKEFDIKKKISEEDFTFILETGRLSPSSFGFEPWKIVVLQDLKLRQNLNDKIWGAKKILPTCSHFIIFLAKKKPLLSGKKLERFMIEIQNIDEEKAKARATKFENFIKKDFKINTDEKLFEWACRQTYIMLANMMTASAMIEIDSCAVEGYSKDIMDEFTEKELKINTKEYGTSVMCGFGYRISSQKEKVRNKLENIALWI